MIPTVSAMKEQLQHMPTPSPAFEDNSQKLSDPKIWYDKVVNKIRKIRKDQISNNFMQKIKREVNAFSVLYSECNFNVEMIFQS